MITQAILTVSLFIGLMTNTYFAGKGQYLKLRKACVGDAIYGIFLLVLAVYFWNL